MSTNPPRAAYGVEKPLNCSSPNRNNPLCAGIILQKTATVFGGCKASREANVPDKMVTERFPDGAENWNMHTQKGP